MCISFGKLNPLIFELKHLEFQHRHVELPSKYGNVPSHHVYMCQKSEMPMGKAAKWPEVVQSLTVSEKQFFEECVALMPDDTMAWSGLGSMGGGEVNGTWYSAKECF